MVNIEPDTKLHCKTDGETVWCTAIWNTKNNGCETGHIQKHLDKWLKGIPDTPKIDDYGVAVGAETNSITKQKGNNWWPYLWVSHVSTEDKIHNKNNNNNKKWVLLFTMNNKKVL